MIAGGASVRQVDSIELMALNDPSPACCLSLARPSSEALIGIHRGRLIGMERVNDC